MVAGLEEQRLMPRARRALDFGCGLGRLTRALSSRFELRPRERLAPALRAGRGRSPARDDPGQELGQGIKLRAPTGQITLRLPASGEAAPVGATSVFRGAGAENNVLTQPIANGARALVRITGPDAPVDYRFPLEGASRLEQLPDGSVLVHDLTGEPSVTIKAPWAKDANGTAVSTTTASRARRSSNTSPTKGPPTPLWLIHRPGTRSSRLSKVASVARSAARRSPGSSARSTPCRMP